MATVKTLRATMMTVMVMIRVAEPTLDSASYEEYTRIHFEMYSSVLHWLHY